MPLRSRRRHKKAAAPQNTGPHPPAQSRLEVLPVEILLRIFLESQNPSFVLTSKTIYSLIGHKPSDWLLIDFFSYSRKGPRIHHGLAQAVVIRGFTLSAYIKWINRFGVLDQYGSRQVPWKYEGEYSIVGGVHLQKRWLRPEDSEILTTLLLDRKIGILPAQWRSYTSATLEEAVRLFLHPAVNIAWPIAIRGFYDELHHLEDREILHNWRIDKEILCTAFKRSDVTVDMLDCLFPIVTDDNGPTYVKERYQQAIADAAFNSRKLVVIKWAVGRGFVPSSHQLKNLFGISSLPWREIVMSHSMRNNTDTSFRSV